MELILRHTNILHISSPRNEMIQTRNGDDTTRNKSGTELSVKDRQLIIINRETRERQPQIMKIGRRTRIEIRIQ